MADRSASILELAQTVLKERFGYDSFRPGQAELAVGVLSGRDCLGVMPTGSGKSLCYQVPAMALAFGCMEGEDKSKEGCQDPMFHPAAAVTLVISPLVSLMSDQVMALRSAGIPAAYLNGRLSPSQQEEVISRARAGAYALLYVAPERLSDQRFLEAVGARSTASSVPGAAVIPIVLVAVDEAHCVSQWGQDFRPSDLGIFEFIGSLPTRPAVAAFTATATPLVQEDIVRLLELRDPLRITTGFDRPNLRFSVDQLPDKKKLARLASLALANANDSGIVYCSTRKDVERVHEALLAAGVRATRYHAGLSHLERETNQRAFVNDDAPVMVATNAFGMGIDKSNVRYVVHFNMPGSLEAYYQEAGRAGRDGEPAECLLMWNDSDIATCRFFIEQESGNEALSPEEQQVVRASQRRRLAAMANYCMTCDCLRATILRYFGEYELGQRSAPFSPPEENGGSQENDWPLHGCGNCSNCEGEVDAVDVTKTARSVMRCVHELRGRFGKGIVADVLCGSTSAKLKEYGLTSKRTYGIVDDPSSTVKEVIELLTAGEYLVISEGRYPIVGLGPRALEAAADEFRLYMKRRRTPVSDTRRKTGKTRPVDEPFVGAHGENPNVVLSPTEQKELFERLRRLRKRLADEEAVPPYIVFSDASLRAMCATLPATEEGFLAVPGVGPTKLSRYGAAFLAEINEGRKNP